MWTNPDYCEKGNSCKRFGLIQVKTNKEEINFIAGPMAAMYCVTCMYFKGIDMFLEPKKFTSFRGNMLNRIILLLDDEISQLDKEMYRIIYFPNGESCEEDNAGVYSKIIIVRNDHKGNLEVK